MKNLNELAEQLSDDLERISTLRTKGLRAYFETLNTQRKNRIRKLLKKLEEDWGDHDHHAGPEDGCNGCKRSNYDRI
jgi:hypothetical protein